MPIRSTTIRSAATPVHRTGRVGKREHLRVAA